MTMQTPDTAPVAPVRLAQRDDEGELMDMVRSMHQESALRSAEGTPIPLDEDMARATLHRAIIPNRNGCDMPAWIGVVGEGRSLMASIYLSMETTWYSAHVILVERWLYVRPEHRKSNLAISLIDFAKKSADAAQTYPLIVGHVSAGREEAKSRFYRRHLGPAIGNYFAHTGQRQAGAL